MKVKPPTGVNIIETLEKTLKKIKLDEFDKKLTIITKRKAKIIV